jgi:ergothioneine biosynthesis protein EgtB
MREHDLPLERNYAEYESLRARFAAIRERTTYLCSPLEIEDYVVQPVAEVSPPKWHLGHTTWFFEHFILEKYFPQYRTFNKTYSLIFNSYYKSAGEHWQQKNRGVLSRPTVEDVRFYRNYVDSHMIEFMDSGPMTNEHRFLLKVGLNHEQQHQELLLMDIKYILGMNPLRCIYIDFELDGEFSRRDGWREIEPGIYNIGSDTQDFAFDNERPCHKVLVGRCSISSSLVTNEEYLEFIQAGGYSRPEFWLSKGWDWVVENRVGMPLYWYQEADVIYEYTLHDIRPLVGAAPVCHISYFEADAYARWKGLRLPTEYEFEILLGLSAAGALKGEKWHDYLAGGFHPRTLSSTGGQLWCWTKSQYAAYPGYTAFAGDLGEYNGKFMCNQFVLKGGCIASPRGHVGPAYRNFFEPQQRWMFSGICLAKDS